MKRPRFYFFDFDGTLANSSTLALGIINHLAKIFHFNVLKDEQQAQYLKDLSTQDAIKYLGIASWKLPFIVFYARRIITKKMTQVPFVHPEIPKVLEELRKRHQLAILSSNSKKNIKIFLHQHNCHDFTIIAQTSLFGKRSKLQRLIKRYHLELKDVIYIGDETRDIQAAKELGVQSVAVTWGHNSRAALIEQKPDFIVEHPFQLLDLS